MNGTFSPLNMLGDLWSMTPMGMLFGGGLGGGGGSGGGNIGNTIGKTAGGFVSSFLTPFLPIVLILGGGFLVFVFISQKTLSSVANSSTANTLASRVQMIPVPI
jgi:hypothetical protein